MLHFVTWVDEGITRTIHGGTLSNTSISEQAISAAIEALRGKRLPLIDRVEIYPIEDEQPRFLAFLNHEHDLLDETPFTFIHQVLPNGKLAPALARQVGEEAPKRHGST